MNNSDIGLDDFEPQKHSDATINMNPNQSSDVVVIPALVTIPKSTLKQWDFFNSVVVQCVQDGDSQLSTIPPLEISGAHMLQCYAFLCRWSDDEESRCPCTKCSKLSTVASKFSNLKSVFMFDCTYVFHLYVLATKFGHTKVIEYIEHMTAELSLEQEMMKEINQMPTSNFRINPSTAAFLVEYFWLYCKVKSTSSFGNEEFRRKIQNPMLFIRQKLLQFEAGSKHTTVADYNSNWTNMASKLVEIMFSDPLYSETVWSQYSLEIWNCLIMPSITRPLSKYIMELYEGVGNTKQIRASSDFLTESLNYPNFKMSHIPKHFEKQLVNTATSLFSSDLIFRCIYSRQSWFLKPASSLESLDKQEEDDSFPWKFSVKSLDGQPFSVCGVLAGGFIAAMVCQLQDDNFSFSSELNSSSNRSLTEFGDLDLFLLFPTENESQTSYGVLFPLVLKLFCQQLSASLGVDLYVVPHQKWLETDGGYPGTSYHVYKINDPVPLNVVLVPVGTVQKLLLGFDFSHCSWAFDGTDLFATLPALDTLKTRVTHLQLLPANEFALLKSKRYENDKQKAVQEQRFKRIIKRMKKIKRRGYQFEDDVERIYEDWCKSESKSNQTTTTKTRTTIQKKLKVEEELDDANNNNNKNNNLSSSYQESQDQIFEEQNLYPKDGWSPDFICWVLAQKHGIDKGDVMCIKTDQSCTI